MYYIMYNKNKIEYKLYQRVGDSKKRTFGM